MVHSVSLAAPPTRKGHRRRSGSTSVVAIHDLAWRHLPKTATRYGGWWHEAALSRAIKQASAFVVPSEATAKDLEDAGVGGGRIHVIPYGSDHLPLPDDRRTDRLLSNSGVGGEFLLAVGTIEPRKNLDRLIAAYAEVRPWLPEQWPLVIVGPTGWGPTDDTKDPVGVIRLGMVDDEVLAGLYSRANLLLYVPLLEGFGFPPLEAMRLGCPVVTSGHVPSVMEAGVVGAAVIVDPFDIDSIASGMIAGAEIDHHRGDAIAQGLLLARQRTWRETATKHLRLWMSLL
jgi:glycosyltransferase involved in cell wall biosynthesis